MPIRVLTAFKHLSFTDLLYTPRSVQLFPAQRGTRDRLAYFHDSLVHRGHACIWSASNPDRLGNLLRVTATGRLHFQDIIFYVRILLQQVVEEEGYSSLELLGLGFDAMGQRSRRI